LPTPAARPAPAAPDNAELMRNPQTRNQWFETVRENHEKRQAPAVREQPAAPVQPSTERDSGRNPQRGAEAGDVRRDRPGLPPASDPRSDPRDGRDPRGDRRNAN